MVLLFLCLSHRRKTDMSDEINESYLPRAKKIIDFFFFSVAFCVFPYRLLGKNELKTFSFFPFLLRLFPFNIKYIKLTHLVPDTIRSYHMYVLEYSLAIATCELLLLLKYRLFPFA
jgi:hypothetical protein